MLSPFFVVFCSVFRASRSGPLGEPFRWKKIKNSFAHKGERVGQQARLREFYDRGFRAREKIRTMPRRAPSRRLQLSLPVTGLGSSLRVKSACER